MFLDQLLLWLHIAFAIFTLGPLTAATMATPRSIRSANVSVLRYLHRTTRIYGAASLLVFGFGLALALDRFNEFWVSASMTLFVVALALLFAIVEPDQRKAIRRLEESEEAKVETGRIVAVSAVIAVVWLVVLVLMIWQPGGP
ncbi:MAG: hypothetical protein GEV03_08830 [Streptosporangiales bacterium]|nr:hypothetical protein [Streptosporangiales bacterium]